MLPDIVGMCGKRLQNFLKIFLRLGKRYFIDVKVMERIQNGF